jgi:hypothetical protein
MADYLHAIPKECPIYRAINVLLNNRKIEEKESVSFNSEILAILRASFRSDQEYLFRLSRVSVLTSGATSLQVNVATDLTQFNEGTALAALFDECKLVKTKWQLRLNNTTGQFPFVMGYEPIVNTVTPTSTNLIRLPVSEIYSTFAVDSASTSYHLTYKAPMSLTLWGLVSDEGVSAPRIRSGLNGTFSIANVTGGAVPTASQVYFAYSLLTLAKFRKRG